MQSNLNFRLMALEFRLRDREERCGKPPCTGEI